jgi:hypothetical protein
VALNGLYPEHGQSEDFIGSCSLGYPDLVLETGMLDVPPE